MEILDIKMSYKAPTVVVVKVNVKGVLCSSVSGQLLDGAGYPTEFEEENE